MKLNWIAIVLGVIGLALLLAGFARLAAGALLFVVAALFLLGALGVGIRGRTHAG
jgi:hypothetical protein